MSNFDEFGNILIPVIRNNRAVLYCPRDGTSTEPRPEQTIFSTNNNERDESSRYQNLIKNAPHDPTTILVKEDPCQVDGCKSTFYKHLRLGSSEKSVKVCMKGHVKNN